MLGVTISTALLAGANEVIEKRRAFLAAFGSAVGPWTLGARAQPSGRRPQIACLVNMRREQVVPSVSEMYLERMRDLGYLEGQGFDIIYRFADTDNAKLAALAEELVRLDPDVIVTLDPDSARAAAKATSSIPIVSAILTDPVSLGLVTSYARPGGNLTGILAAVEGLAGKQIEIAVELIPGITTIGLLINPTNSTSGAQRQQIEAAATTKHVKIVAAEIRVKADFDTAFNVLSNSCVQAVIAARDGLLISETRRIAELAVASHLPTVFGLREQVEAGGLISYGVSLSENYRRAAYFVDRILNGAKPGNLPVEFPTRVYSVINMKTANRLCLTVSQSLLLRADEVVE